MLLCTRPGIVADVLFQITSAVVFLFFGEARVSAALLAMSAAGDSDCWCVRYASVSTPLFDSLFRGQQH